MQVLIQEVWDGAWEPAFLTSSQMLLMLLVSTTCEYQESEVVSSHFKERKNGLRSLLKKQIPGLTWKCQGWGLGNCILNKSSGELIHSVVQRPHLQNVVSLPMVFPGVYLFRTPWSEHLAERSCIQLTWSWNWAESLWCLAPRPELQLTDSEIPYHSG